MIDIYVINLKHRTDRKEQMIKKFKQFEKINYPKETLLKISMGHCTNLIIYNKKVYDYILSTNEHTSLAIDHEWHNTLNAIITVPFIVSTENDYSDIIKKNMNYTRKFKITERQLMKEFW